MARITDDAYDQRYATPKYKVPKYATPKTSYTPTYREEPYDNSGAMRAAEQARLIREAQQRQAAQERQAEIQRGIAMQKQAAIDRAAQSRISLGGGLPLNPKNMWDNYKTAQAKGQANFGNNWAALQPAYGQAFNSVNEFIRQGLGYAPMESWQQQGVGTPRHTYNDYDRAGNYAGGNYPWMQQGYYDAYQQPGWGDDWGMMQSGNVGNRFGGGQLDRANWGMGVPSWEEVLATGDPNAHDPYDPAGNPYFVSEDIPYDNYGGGGGYGYGGGSYSSKPGYYGGNQSYGAKYYENLLQWNI